MRKLNCLIIGLFIAITAIGRPVPHPGDANVVGVPHPVVAQSDVLRKTLFLTVDDASGQYQPYLHQHLLLKFVLPSNYQLYLYNHWEYLLSQGNYGYAIDYNDVTSSHINLEGKKGLNVTLFFKTDYEGTFYAKPNQMQVKGSLKGRFRLF